jgi:hypothetical protein
MPQPTDIFGPIAALARAAAITLPSEMTKSPTTTMRDDPNRIASECDAASGDDTAPDRPPAGARRKAARALALILATGAIWLIASPVVAQESARQHSIDRYVGDSGQPRN